MQEVGDVPGGGGGRGGEGTRSPKLIVSG